MSKKTSLALIIIVLIVVSAVTVYFYLPHGGNTSKVTAGVKAGDVFTYQMVGYAESHKDIDTPAQFADVNNTKYYRVEITKVEVPIVSYTETWEFNNGTKNSFEGKINLENGLHSGGSGYFWNIYASDLSVGSLSRPDDRDQPKVSETTTKSYPDGDREINFLRSEYEMYDPTDQTFTSTCYVYHYVHFDKQTGMVIEYNTRQIFNTPEIMLIVEYTIVSSNVIKVS